MTELIQVASSTLQGIHHSPKMTIQALSVTSSFKAPSIITRTQADCTIRLTKGQYQALARICKMEAGKPLNIASETDMEGDWGMINYWGLPVIDDATKPDQLYDEKAYIHIAHLINTASLRAAGQERPECDWSKLKNSELFEFIVWHEIGHFRDNFHPVDYFFAHDLSPEALQASKMVPNINEILADRFAWGRIRPGQPMPLTKAGRLHADRIERSIEELSRFFTRGRFTLKPLDPGQYRHVPAYMLTSKRKAAYVGPDVHPDLLKREVGRYRESMKGPRPLTWAGL